MSAKIQKRPARRSSDDVRAAILTHATRLFANRGFDAVAMRDISVASKVPLSGIYRYFRDKRALYTECEVDSFRKVTNSIFRKAIEADTAHQALFQLTKAHCELHLGKTAVSKLTLRQLVEEDYESLKKLADLVIAPPSLELSKKIASLTPNADPLKKIFDILVMTWGITLQTPLGKLLGWDLKHLESSEKISLHVLSMVFPSENWGERFASAADVQDSRVRLKKRC